MKWTIMLSTALALALAAAAQAAPARPACSEAQAVAEVLDGQYASVECPEGRLLVTVRAGQPLPAVGPARVTARSVRGGGQVYRLSAGGRTYPIVQQ